MKRIAVLTSGGDAPGMNAAIRAVVRYGIYYDMEVFSVHSGFEGLIDGKFERMHRRSVADILHRGGTIIKTSRSERFLDHEYRMKAYENMQKLGIEGLIVIGGNGSLTGAKAIAEETGIAVIGVPGTIDNDLAYTEYTIGFDTAVNTVLEAVSKLRDTNASHERSAMVEVMGRNCGDIALYAGYAAGAEIVLLPESNTDLVDLCGKVREGVESGKLHNIIIRAEGYPISSQEVVRVLKEETGQDVKLVVLSYLQRGGSPTFRDRMLASECGQLAVELLRDGVGSRAVGVAQGKVTHFDLVKALNAKSSLREELLEGINILSM